MGRYVYKLLYKMTSKSEIKIFVLIKTKIFYIILL